MDTLPAIHKTPALPSRTTIAMLASLAAVFLIGHLSGRQSGTSRDASRVWRMRADGPPACSKVYVDLGTNVGDAVDDFSRGLLQASQPHALENVTGVPFRSEEFCVYGFEGNPRWTATLRRKERHLRPKFRAVRIFSETVVDVKNGTATLYLDTVNEAQNFWGSSMIASHNDVESSGKVGVDVAAVDFAEFLRGRTTVLEPGATYADRLVIVRMDVEGMEYSILQSLVSTGLLCNRVDFLLVEWHAWVVNDPALRDDFARKTELFKWLLESPRCHTKILTA